jgi:hypothetical protein
MAPLDFMLRWFRFGGKRHGACIVYGCNEPPQDRYIKGLPPLNGRTQVRLQFLAHCLCGVWLTGDHGEFATQISDIQRV